MKFFNDIIDLKSDYILTNSPFNGARSHIGEALFMDVSEGGGGW